VAEGRTSVQAHFYSGSHRPPLIWALDSLRCYLLTHNLFDDVRPRCGSHSKWLPWLPPLTTPPSRFAFVDGRQMMAVKAFCRIAVRKFLAYGARCVYPLPLLFSRLSAPPALLLHPLFSGGRPKPRCHRTSLLAVVFRRYGVLLVVLCRLLYYLAFPPCVTLMLLFP